MLETKKERKEYLNSNLNYIENYSECKYSLSGVNLDLIKFDINNLICELEKEGIFLITISKDYAKFSRFKNALEELTKYKEEKRKRVIKNIELPLPFREFTNKELFYIVAESKYIEEASNKDGAINIWNNALLR